MGPYRTIWDHTGTICDQIGPYRTLQDYTGPYGIIRDHTDCLFTGTVPVRYTLFRGTVPVNISYIICLIREVRPQILGFIRINVLITGSSNFGTF